MEELRKETRKENKDSIIDLLQKTEYLYEKEVQMKRKFELESSLSSLIPVDEVDTAIQKKAQNKELSSPAPTSISEKSVGQSRDFKPDKKTGTIPKKVSRKRTKPMSSSEDFSVTEKTYEGLPKPGDTARKNTSPSSKTEEKQLCSTRSSTSLETSTTTPERSREDTRKTKQVFKEQEYKFKILVMGDVGTGKSCIIRRYTQNCFSQNYQATIGVDFFIKTVKWNENTTIQLHIWDMAGQEKVTSMTSAFYKRSYGALIVYDVSNPESFDTVVKWKATLDNKVILPNTAPLPCILLANKCDLKKWYNTNNLDYFCSVHCFTSWFVTSAKENINIEEAFNSLITEMVKNKDTYGNKPLLQPETIFLHNWTDNEPVNRRRKTCHC